MIAAGRFRYLTFDCYGTLVDWETGILAALPDSLGNWPLFADTVESLSLLRGRFGLAIVSNIDGALFAATARHLPDCFDDVITAEQVRSYKPSRAHFDQALRRLGEPRGTILHVVDLATLARRLVRS